MNKITYKEFEELSYGQKFCLLTENFDDVHTFEDLRDMAINEIENDNLLVAYHILDGLVHKPEDLYIYDRYMGTFGEIIPLDLSDDENVLQFLESRDFLEE